jgi:ComF family protein
MANPGQWLCAQCSKKMQMLEASPACSRCGMPVAHADAPCPHCHGKGLTFYDQVLRIGSFREPLTHLIHQMKYHRRWTLAEQLADRLLQQADVRNLLSGTDCLLPVPLHRFRQFTRGYNQAEVIAKALARLTRLPVLHALRRVRHTQTQTHLPRTQRDENLRDAFALRPGGKRVFGKRLVVIDDVLTSGATLRAAARALKPAGPASISAIVVAVADAKHQDFTAI